MKSIKALIVDDEPLAREGLRNLLGRIKDVEVTGECADGVQAIDDIRSKRPDLVFLDIQMPEINGFDVVEQVGPGSMPAVVFVTAFDEHAMRAFDVYALDYLLKPVDPDRLVVSVERVRAYLAGTRKEETGERLERLLEDIRNGKKYPDRIMVKTPGRITFLDVKEIDWIEAQGDYICIHAKGKKHLIRDRISEIEKRLDPTLFARVHRSTIVCLAQIRELQPLFSGEYSVLLFSGEKLTMSRSYRDRVLETLHYGGKAR
jgi:two-component system LytT family response regulator